MKPKYLKPETEVVNIKLFGSILNEGDVVNGSKGAEGEAWAKDVDMDDFNSEEDIWGGRQTKDVWER